MEREKLKSEGANVLEVSGRYLFTVSFTQRATELINDEGRIKGESWLDYRNRTKAELDSEQQKRIDLAKEIADAYNEKYFQ